MPTLARILAENGPLDEVDIVRRLQDSGIADAEGVVDELLDELVSPVRKMADERWLWLPAAVEGRVFTHRVSADEVTHDFLTVNPNLNPITALCDYEGYRQFADGQDANVALPGYDDELIEERDIPRGVIEEGGALLLQSGTLEKLGVSEGGLVGIWLTPEGLVVDRVTALAQASTEGARLKSMVDNAGEPVFLDLAIFTVCVEDPTAFTEPLPPLTEIVDGCGIARDMNSLAPAGFDFDAWRFELNSSRLAQQYDLDPDDAAALYALTQMFDQMWMALDGASDELPAPEMVVEAPEPPPLADLMGSVGGVLADPLLAALFADNTAGTEARGAATLGLFAETLEPKVPRTARVACRWLRATALERLGDIEDAERELLAAESMDPDWPLPLLDLARFASDRGDVERGVSLLHRAGVAPDDELLVLLEQHRPGPRADMGRNDPCWCGSGRKYKKCHLGREQLPLADRVKWLYAKAAHHVSRTGWEELLFEVAYELGRHSDNDPREAVEAAMSYPLVMDAVLFEGGALADFLDVRGSLLPDDERMLAEQWLLLDRSVFEIEDVRPGQGVTVRDVRTGDTHEVRERAGSRELKSGHLICARVIPAGDTLQFSGALEPVALHERDALIDLLDTEPDAVTLVAQLSRRFAPPMLTNTEGDPTAMCEALVRVGPGIEAALDDSYDRVDDSSQWLEHVVTHGMPRIRATLRLDGDTLRVQTNSEKRMDRVLATLARLHPAMDVLEDTREPVPTAREAAALAKRMPHAGEGALDPADPQVAAALDEFIREYETKWLDEPIPALDGHTPRQAADDPTRRGDLIKLLDTFPAGEAARGGMDADRLRDALDL
ncbi:SEC-C metal-binding domain-containing protein [Mycolicibacterium tusciae]|uniref:SEC-C metal-binding domain-containing protein n=1 Tax=Mycolicibacterium tusciae TaxID=75922 RepID=UPI00058D9900